MKTEELKALRTRLKTGEYNGVDIMQAWLAIDRLIECQDSLKENVYVELGKEAALTALGHIQILNDRCPAINEGKDRVPGLRPASPPRACARKAGHEGPHGSVYGANRTLMTSDIVMRDMPDLCGKCGVRWPCGDAAKVIRAFDTGDTEEHF